MLFIYPAVVSFGIASCVTLVVHSIWRLTGSCRVVFAVAVRRVASPYKWPFNRVKTICGYFGKAIRMIKFNRRLHRRDCIEP